MGLAMDEVCSTCQQSCKQYTGFSYKFNFTKCKLWAGRNAMMQPTFNEKLVLASLKQEQAMEGSKGGNNKRHHNNK